MYAGSDMVMHCVPAHCIVTLYSFLKWDTIQLEVLVETFLSSASEITILLHWDRMVIWHHLPQSTGDQSFFAEFVHQQLIWLAMYIAAMASTGCFILLVVLMVFRFYARSWSKPVTHYYKARANLSIISDLIMLIKYNLTVIFIIWKFTGITTDLGTCLFSTIIRTSTLELVKMPLILISRGCSIMIQNHNGLPPLNVKS